jgi:hypothetical protein
MVSENVRLFENVRVLRSSGEVERALNRRNSVEVIAFDAQFSDASRAPGVVCILKDWETPDRPYSVHGDYALGFWPRRKFRDVTEAISHARWVIRLYEVVAA